MSSAGAGKGSRNKEADVEEYFVPQRESSAHTTCAQNVCTQICIFMLL